MQLILCLLIANLALSQKGSIKISVEGISDSDYISLNDLRFSNNISQDNEKIDLKSITGEQSKHTFLLDFSKLQDGVYEVSISSSNYSSINFIRFIVNNKSRGSEQAERVIHVEKNKSMGNSNGFIVLGGEVHQENFPYLMVQGQRKEWDCFMKGKLKKDLLDSLIKMNKVITFSVEWNDEGEIINLFFENNPSAEIKTAFENILYSSPIWVRPSIDVWPIECYRLTFDASKIDDCD